MSESIRPEETDSVQPNGVVFSYKDIYSVVDAFYRRVAVDPVLSVPFQSVHDWPEHIDRLTNFWWIKFGGKPFLFSQYNPVAKHYFAGFNSELLKRWLALFHEVLAENLNAQQAGLWKLVSERMGHALTMKNDFFAEEMKKQESDKG